MADEELLNPFKSFAPASGAQGQGVFVPTAASAPVAPAPPPQPGTEAMFVQAARTGHDPTKVDKYAPAPTAVDIVAKPQPTAPVAPQEGFRPAPMGGPMRPAGPSPFTGMLGQLDASDKRVQGGLENARDKNAEAQSAVGDVGWGTQAANQETQDRIWGNPGTTDENGETVGRVVGVQQQQQEHMTRAADSMRATRAEIDAELKNLPAIDPQKWFKSKGAGEGMMAAIGVALGAAASGISKGAVPNAALQLVQSSMDREMDAQKANVQTRLAAIQKKHEFLKDDWAKATWQSDQYDRLKVEFAEKGRMQIAGYMAQAKTAEDRSKLAGLDAALVTEKEKYEKEMIMRRYNALQAQAAGGGGGSSEAQMQQRYQKYAQGQLDKRESPIPWSQYRSTMMGNPQGNGGGSSGQVYSSLDAIPKADRGNGVQIAPGQFVVAANKEAANKAMDKAGYFQAMVDNRQRALELRKGRGVIDPNTTQALEQLDAEYATVAGKAFDMGVMSKDEKENVIASGGGAAAGRSVPVVGANRDQALARGIENTKRLKEQLLQSQGLTLPKTTPQAGAALPFGAKPRGQ